jgi:hypothetical protein
MRERLFKIDAYTPRTMPMVRLAEYMSDLGILLGEPEHVHFLRVDEGSTQLVHFIEDEALPKIDERLDCTRRGEGPSDAIAAFERINRRLREDNGTGVLIEDATGAEIIRFPGRENIEPVTFNAFNQPGTLDGIVIVVGGKADPVPVHIQSVEDAGLIYNCYGARALAKELAQYIFGPEIRVSGTGRWLRDAEGKWNLERFVIVGFAPLNNQSLTSIIASLRAVPGSEWESLKDPWVELDLIRNGPHEDGE